MPGNQRRLAAVLFSDIEGYSEQMDQDEEGALTRLERHNQVFDREIQREHGTVIKTMGDAYMVEFSTARSAVKCALRVQSSLAEQDGEPILVRIGIHVGDVIDQGGDLFGETVNVAARIEKFSPPGAVCVSEAVLQQVKRKVNATLTSLGVRELKNISTPFQLYALEPSDHLLVDGPATVVPPTTTRTESRGQWLVAITLLLAMGGAGLWLLKRSQPTDDGSMGAVASTSPEALESASGGGSAATQTLRVAITVRRGPSVVYPSAWSLDAYVSSLRRDRLVELSADGAAQPGALAEWEAEGKGVRLVLRDDLEFAPAPCVAERADRGASSHDLLASLRLAVDRGVLSLPIDAAREDWGRVAGPRAVELTVTRPFTMERLHNTFLVPREFESCRSDQGVDPPGTGPHRLQSSTERSVLLEKAPKHWRHHRNPKMPPRLEILVAPEKPSTAIHSVATGEVDILWLSSGGPASFLDGAGTHDAKLKDRFAKAAVTVAPVALPPVIAPVVLAFASQGSQAIPRRLRRAISQALDRKVLSTHDPLPCKPSAGFLRIGALGYRPTRAVPPRNVAAARAVVHQLGAQDRAITVGTSSRRRGMCAELARSVAEAGIRIDCREVAPEHLSRWLEEGADLDAMLINYFEPLHGRNPATYFRTLARALAALGHDTGEIIRQLEEAEGLQTAEDRGRVFGAIEDLLVEDSAMIPIAQLSRDHVFDYWIIGSRVQGAVEPSTGTVCCYSHRFFDKVMLAGQPPAR